MKRYNFLLGGQKKNNSIGDREWNDLCKCQFKPDSLTDILFLVRTTEKPTQSRESMLKIQYDEPVEIIQIIIIMTTTRLHDLTFQ